MIRLRLLLIGIVAVPVLLVGTADASLPAEDSGPTPALTGVYRVDEARFIVVRGNAPNDLSILDSRTGHVRNLVRERKGAYVHGPTRSRTRRVLVETRDGGRLRGQLILPQTPGPHPVAVIVPLGNRQSLWEPAMWLRAAGLGVLVYDQRGSGDSSGQVFDPANSHTHVTLQLADDAVAMLEHVRELPGVDPNRVVSDFRMGWAEYLDVRDEFRQRQRRDPAVFEFVTEWVRERVAPEAAEPGTQETNPAAWRADLDYLVERLPVRHPDPYHDVDEADFRSAVRFLQRRVADLEEHQRLVGLTRIMALVGDGHTSYPLLWDDGNGFRRYPVELFPTARGATVLATAPGREELLGAQVIAVDGRPLREVLAAVLPLDSRDHRLAPKLAWALMAVPAVLHAVGVAASPDSARFELAMPSGEVRELTLRAIPAPDPPQGYDHPPDWRLAGGEGRVPLWLRRRDDAFWLQVLEESNTLYVQYNDASVQENEAGEPLTAFADRLVRRARSEAVERVVLDLRWNDGGSAWISRTLLQGLVQAERSLGGRRTGRREERTPQGKLFVLTGPGTFSAGTLLAAQLEWHTDAVFVGRPTGSRPNAYGETGRIRLPRTGYPVRTSIAYNQGTEASDSRPAIFPDVPVEYRSAHLREGADPAMEAVRNWAPEELSEDRLVGAYRGGGLEAALGQYRRMAGSSLSVLDRQVLLLRLADHLVESGRRGEALRVLGLAVDRFPWAAWTYARRARIHDGRGDEAGAVENACRAYALSYYRTGMLDILDGYGALECARRTSIRLR